MSSDPPFEHSKVTDADIHFASGLLKLLADAFYSADGSDPRQDVLKSIEQLDVAGQAFALSTRAST
jgi:hypothetical protein